LGAFSPEGVFVGVCPAGAGGSARPRGGRARARGESPPPPRGRREKSGGGAKPRPPEVEPPRSGHIPGFVGIVWPFGSTFIFDTRLGSRNAAPWIVPVFVCRMLMPPVSVGSPVAAS